MSNNAPAMVQANVIEVDISLVHPNPSNPRTIKDANFKKLVKSLKEFPQMLWKRPPVVVTNGDGYMALGGNKRTEAAKAAGYKTIPIMIADEWDAEQRKRFVVLDNDSSGEWDFQMLRDQYAMDFLLDTTSIMIPSRLLRGDNTLQDDFVPPDTDQVKTDIVPGTLITIGPHRLVCGSNGEARMVDLLMDGRLADLVVTDPVYGVDYIGKTKAKHEVTNDGKLTLPGILDGAFRQYMRVVRDGCPFYITAPAGPNLMAFLTALAENGVDTRQLMVWVKDSMVMGHSDYHYRHEMIILAYKPGKGRLGRGGEAWCGGNNQNTVFEYPRPQRNADHATEKPVDLFAQFMRNHSAIGDIVADLFVGSGTTMVAAHDLDRAAYCMDIDPRCCQVVVDRMKALDPKLQVKVHLPG